MTEGAFREDLYFRLNGAVLTLPPLRRRADVGRLVDVLLERRRSSCGEPLSLSEEARAALCAHSWPGNVRELVNCLDYASAVCPGSEISLDDLPETLLAAATFALAPPERPAPAAEAGEDALPHLLETLREHRWNVSAVAPALGVDRTTVHRRMRRLGLVPPQKRGF
ncbi:helix-turn-helix domain-containing protein [Methylocella sp.]|uniref:helix-turn-helix domain-containing protein n=1 Tax=Methylocella sp. TaxID=1978226 RepID=UPI003783E301